MSESFYRLKEPFTTIKFDSDGTWHLYIGDKVVATLLLASDEYDELYRAFTNILFERGEYGIVCHKWYGGIDRGSILTVYDERARDEDLLLSEYGGIFTFKNIIKKAHSVVHKPRRFDA